MISPPTTPTLTAATAVRKGCMASTPLLTSREHARCRATYAPVMDTVRVPPSACNTSQSSVIVRGPSAPISTTARNERPIKRWISCVRPLTRPSRSRELRVWVARGNILYSAVTHPWPLPSRNGGTFSSILAAHSTRVFPASINTDPRRSPGNLPSGAQGVVDSERGCLYVSLLNPFQCLIITVPVTNNKFCGLIVILSQETSPILLPKYGTILGGKFVHLYVQMCLFLCQ